MSPATHERLTGAAIVANLVGQILIIGTGGAVRLTGSGLGCSTWPQCEPGSFTPQFHAATSIHPYVEFGNRMMSAVLVVLALAVVVLVHTLPRHGGAPARSEEFRKLSIVPIAGVLVQAVVGGITVLIDLHPAVVGSHFLLSAALVWVSAWLWVRWREGDGPPAPVTDRSLVVPAVAVSALAAAVVTLGVVVTGAGPHSGDDEVGYRFAVDPLLVTKMHSGAVWLFVAAVAVLLVSLYRSHPHPDLPDGARHLTRARHRVWVLVGVTAAQGALGYYQYFNGLPELVVGMHLIGAALLIVATTVAMLGLRVRPEVETDPHSAYFRRLSAAQGAD